MPKYEDDSKYGDLFVTYSVEFPKELSDSQKEVVKQTFNM